MIPCTLGLLYVQSGRFLSVTDFHSEGKAVQVEMLPGRVAQLGMSQPGVRKSSPASQ
jgi:UPF0288 family protein (methanogenesis marker protein 3)